MADHDGATGAPDPTSGDAMPAERMLVVAVDGWRPEDSSLLASDPTLSRLPGIRDLLIDPGGANEPFTALAGLLTGCTSAVSGVASEAPFDPVGEAPSRHWYAEALARPTLLDAARAAGRRTAALQWPATAGGAVDLCLPLVEDLHRFRDRWEMTVATSSPEMVEHHLRPRIEAGAHLSRVPRDELIGQIASETLGPRQDRAVDLALVRLEGLSLARREIGTDLGRLRAARAALSRDLGAVLAAFEPGPHDVVAIVTGRPLVPVRLLLHPNAELARAGLVRLDGNRIAAWDAFVWPDGSRGVLHVRAGLPPDRARRAVGALERIAAEHGAIVRPVDQGTGATAVSDAVAVLVGAPGTVVEGSAARRFAVPGDDPYYAGPRAVTDPAAAAVTRVAGPGLPASGAHGGWADLGVDLAHALGLSLPHATARGLRSRGAQDLRRAS